MLKEDQSTMPNGSSETLILCKHLLVKKLNLIEFIKNLSDTVLQMIKRSIYAMYMLIIYLALVNK